jgi:hypothetical protein
MDMGLPTGLILHPRNATDSYKVNTLQINDFYLENRDNKLLRKVGRHLPVNNISFSRSQPSLEDT